MSAGLATLRLLGDQSYARLETLAQRLEDGLVKGVRQSSVAARVQRRGSMWTLFFSHEPVVDYVSAKRCDSAAFARFFHNMLDRGIYLPPSQFEAAFISLAHNEADIDATVSAAADSLKELRAAPGPAGPDCRTDTP
jgi:glutamate-1-semialdehyde 2,1-aminomutase